MSKAIDEILAPRPEARPRIYTYLIADAMLRLSVGLKAPDDLIADLNQALG